MALTFYGSWSLTVVNSINNSDRGVRIRIQGSTDADGTHDAIAGQGIASIDGPVWSLSLEFTPNGGKNWTENTLHRQPAVNATDGLAIEVTADENNNGDIWADVKLVYLNRDVNPVPSGKPPFGFTVPAYLPSRSSTKGGFGRGASSCCNCLNLKPRVKSRCSCHR